MSKPIVKNSAKGKQEKPFAGLRPVKVTALKTEVFINPTEAIRLIRDGK